VKYPLQYKSLRFKIGVFLVLAIGLVLLSWEGFQEGYSSHPSTPAGPSTGIKTSKNFPGNLKPYQGNHYSAHIPRGWKVNETRNGIDILDPNYQGLVGSSHAILVGGFGQTSPSGFAQWSIQAMGGQITKVIRDTPLPSITGALNIPWQRSLSEFLVNYRGQTIHVMSETSIANGFGQFCAMNLMMMSPENMWSKTAPVLAEVAKSIKIVNASQMGGVAGQGRVLPRNNPIDDSAIMGAWENRQQSDARLNREWQEAIMGFENVTDHQRGQHFQLPYTYYDPTQHGYRNPNDPNEILYPDQ